MTMRTRFRIEAALLTSLLLCIVSCGESDRSGASSKMQAASSSTVGQDILVAVTREPTNGITDKHLTNPSFVKILEEELVAKMKSRSEQAYRSNGGKGEFQFSFSSESWSVTTRNKPFAIIRVNGSSAIQTTIIIGIQKDVFVKISCMRKGAEIVPHSYGPCADKMAQEFGFSLAVNDR